MFFSGKSKKTLEDQIESQMKEAYKNGEIIRCYNLMKLMLRVNPNNKLLKKYANKIDEKTISKEKYKWALGGSTLSLIFRSPSLYLYFRILYFFWKLK